MRGSSGVLFCLLAVATLHCSRAPRRPADQPALKARFDALQDTMNQKAKATQERFHAMSVPELLTELEQADLRGREPFNSAAFREIITRTDAAEPLLASIQEPSQRNYFKLMALKRLDQDRYAKVPPKDGAAILVDALKRSEVFNAWGIPGFYWESSAKAIISYGPAAVPYLEPLLADKRPAPMWGSEEVRVYEQYRFRVCDYALALLSAIRGNDTGAPAVSPETRDSVIRRYRKGPG